MPSPRRRAGCEQPESRPAPLATGLAITGRRRRRRGRHRGDGMAVRPLRLPADVRAVRDLDRAGDGLARGRAGAAARAGRRSPGLDPGRARGAASSPARSPGRPRSRSGSRWWRCTRPGRFIRRPASIRWSSSSTTCRGASCWRRSPSARCCSRPLRSSGTTVVRRGSLAGALVVSASTPPTAYAYSQRGSSAASRKRSGRRRARSVRRRSMERGQRRAMADRDDGRARQPLVAAAGRARPPPARRARRSPRRETG